MLLQAVVQAQTRSDHSTRAILDHLGIAPATYYRYKARAQTGTLADRWAPPHRRVVLPTPDEVEAVCAFALDHPTMGYKRLSWLMVDRDVACLRPYQVYGILTEAGLIRRQAGAGPEELRRPAQPDHPDQVWHIDLMYVYIRPRWYYLVDILDGYSRFLVHWSLNRTLAAEAVTLAVQAALETLDDRRPGDPALVHDHGSQFLSREWRTFVAGAGLVDIKTRVAHPESNGRLERLHRTHREEALVGEATSDYFRAVDAMARWSHYYNYQRPHSALCYLPPAEYYRGDPQARLAERRSKLAMALEARKAYWDNHAHGEPESSQN